MLRFFLLALILSYNAYAIKVPIQYNSTELTSEDDDSRNVTASASTQDAYSTTDSYQIQLEDQSNPTSYDYIDPDTDKIPVPSRHLLPPYLEAKIFAFPTDFQTDQEDWTPMDHKMSNPDSSPPVATIQQPEKVNTELELPAQSIKQIFKPKLHVIPIKINVEENDSTENSKVLNLQTVPSRHLQPPLLENVAIADFEIPVPATNLQPPLYIPEPKFKQSSKTLKLLPIPTISLQMQPPLRYSTPTKFYPKKYSKANAYKPIPIPMHEFHEGDIFKIPKAKPVQYFKPANGQDDFVEPIEDEKKFLKYQQAQEKRKFQDEENARKQQEFVDSTVAEAFASPETSNEQEASETGFYADNGQDSYVAEIPEQAPVAEAEPPAPSERTEFRMHGLQGPHSYTFGYDTGKGKNRQFRYEERNNDGHVRGHYGYVDRHGKTQVVNYDAHPERGFHAEGPFGKA